jgi:hypothetical protein
MIKKAFRIIGYSLVVILFLLAIFLGMTQTSIFRESVREFAVEKAGEVLNGELRLGKIEGTFITGLVLKDVEWLYRDEIPISVERIDVSVNPFGFLKKEIHLRHVVLIHPEIHMQRDSNAILNLAQLIKKRESDDPDSLIEPEEKSPSPWRYKIDRLEIRDGAFGYRDQVRKSGPKTRVVRVADPVDFKNISVDSLNIYLSFEMGGGEYTFDVRFLGFLLLEPFYRVEQLSFYASIGPSLSEIRNLRMVGEHTAIQLDAAIYEYNLFGNNRGRDIRDCDLFLSMLANKVDFEDLKMFIPAVWFLEGGATASALVDGTLDSLNIHGVTAKLDRSSVSVTGHILETTRGQDLFIDAAIVESYIDPVEVNELLPHFAIPEFGDVGISKVLGRYTGKPRDFFASVELESAEERYSGELALDITGEVMVYDGKVSAERADVSRLLKKDFFPGNLTMNAEIKGRGTRTGELDNRLGAFVHTMEVAGIAFDSLTIHAGGLGADVTVDVSGYIEEALFSAYLSGGLENIASDPFHVSLTARSVDLSRILKDTSYTSDLTFQLAADGRGFVPSEMLGAVTVQFEPSSFRDYTFRGEPMYVSMAEIDAYNREFTVRSEIADIYIAGEFDLPTFVDIATEHLKEIIATVRNDIDGIMQGKKTELAGFDELSLFDRDIDAVYEIEIKNISPIAVFLGRDKFEIDARGLAYGYVRSNESVMSVGGDFRIDHLFYIDETERVLLDAANGFYNIENDFITGGVAGINAIVSLQARAVYTSGFSGNNITLVLDMQGPSWELASSVTIDTALNISIESFARFDTTSVTADIVKLNLKYGEFNFDNSDTLKLRFDKSGIWVDRFTMQQDRMSRISLSGLLALEGNHLLDFSLVDIDVEHLHSISSELDLRRRQNLIRGKASVAGLLRGHHRNPYATAKVTISDVAYRSVLFGALVGNFSYEDRRMIFDVSMKKPDEEINVALLLAGYLPFNLFPTDGAERFPEGPLEIKLFSDGFDLSILDPFIPVLVNFGGSMTSNIVISGTLDDPYYEGELEVRGGEFTFFRNNITYLFNGRVEPRQNELYISSLVLENRRREYPDGRIALSGIVQTRGLQIRAFDLRADGQLMALRAVSRQPGDSFYGDLVVATGSQGVRLNGTVDESMLTGTLAIRSANLVFPPTRTTAYDRTGTIVSYLTIDDTSTVTETLSPLESFFRGIASGNIQQSNDISAASRFLAGLDYDIVIQTDGRVELTMVFNQTTREELNAYIETTSLRLYSDDLTGLRLIGNVEIREPSVYSFYRRFDATGRLRFVGPPDNPELDITATYSAQRIPRTADGTSAGRPEQVVVTLHITGDRYEPKLAVDLTVDEQQWEGDRETDAISFILTGRFQSELNQSDYNRISADFGRGVPTTFVSGVATSLLSSVFSDFLRNEVRFIRTAEIVWYGGNIMETAELRISGELRNFYWTVGGRVFNDLNNTNFSFQIPIGTAFNIDKYTNLFLELERRSRALEYSADNPLRPVNSARLYYSISF